MSFPAHEVYAKCLLGLRGYPLWRPEPPRELPEEYQRRGLQIGDLGFVSPDEGNFDVLFNITMPENRQPYQARFTPEGFIPVVLNDGDLVYTSDAIDPHVSMPSKSVKQNSQVIHSDAQEPRRANYEFSLPSKCDGAVLILPEGAESCFLRNKQRFLDEAIQEGLHWYKCATQNAGRLIDNNSLYLITGVYKTPSWALAAAGRSSLVLENQSTIQFTVGQTHQNIATAKAYSWVPRSADEFMSRAGPNNPFEASSFNSDGRNRWAVNQTIFVQGFRITLNKMLFLKKVSVETTQGTISGSWCYGSNRSTRTSESILASGAGGTEPAVDQDFSLDRSQLHMDSGIAITHMPDMSRTFHPGDCINKYMLKQKPFAKIAITHDSLWIEMLRMGLLELEDFSNENHLQDVLSKSYQIDVKEDVVYNHFGHLPATSGSLESASFSDENRPWGVLPKNHQIMIKEGSVYDHLNHLPATYVGHEYAFRMVDGSNNNPHFPDLGKAGTPYARSVQQKSPSPYNQLPNAGLVFDTLLRRDEFRKHPAGLSALMFSFAALVAYSVFRTDHRQTNLNMTSGYIDLAPLYGNNQAVQDKIRIKDGRGCLHPDIFAEDRLLLLPPATAVLLVLFNRNHNYIARRLLEINERGTWKDPSTLSPWDSGLLKQEEEIFQIARLCNCGWFTAVVLSDYFSAILGIVPKDPNPYSETFDELRNDDELGRGNACSVEFNCLYRWHATICCEDEEWIKKLLEKYFPGKEPNQITVSEFYRTTTQLEAIEPGVEHWSTNGLQRQEDGSFKDSDMARILQDSTSHCAAAFGARGTPGVMRLHEIMGIETARSWGVCSLNDFRKSMGLKTYSSFEEWNPNKKVAEAAEKLYGHIDSLELYVGLQAENTEPIMENTGLCAGSTISRAILSDVAALVRGDRFFTQDFTPHNLTAWGFVDCQRDPGAWGFGSTLGRLLLRTLPYDYDEKSLHTWFPFRQPEAMEMYLKGMGKLSDYSSNRPRNRVPPTTVSGYVEVEEVLGNTQSFTPVSERRASEVIEGKGFLSALADSTRVQKEFISALVPSPDAIEKIGKYFYEKTAELISASSYSLINTNTRGVDIVGDVLKLVPIYWAASEIAGIQLKDNRHQSGVYTPRELYNILGEIYQFIFLDVEPARYMVLRQKVQGHVKELSHHIKATLGIAGSRVSMARIFGTIFGEERSSHDELLNRLFELGHSNDQVVHEILALLVGVTVEISLALTNVINLLLDLEGFCTRARDPDIKNLAGLEAYVIEALRIDPPFAGVSYIAKKDCVFGSLVAQQGEHLFLDIASASINEEAFPNPTTFDAARTPRERYLRPEAAFKVVGTEIPPKLIVQVLRSILSLDDVRRGPNRSGQLQRFRDSSLKDLQYVYLDEHQRRSPWPTSLVILYEEPPSAT